MQVLLEELTVLFVDDFEAIGVAPSSFLIIHGSEAEGNLDALASSGGLVIRLVGVLRLSDVAFEFVRSIMN